MYSPTELLITQHRDIYKVDRGTGAITLWADDIAVDPGSYPSPLLGMELAGDGAVYVSDQSGGAIYRVEANGVVSATYQFDEISYDPVVTSDGTLYSGGYDAIWRVESDGSVTRVAHLQGLKRSAFNPLDGWIYSALFPTSSNPDPTLYRVHPLTGAVELVTTLPTIGLDLQVGASGKLYANMLGGDLHILNPDGSLDRSLIRAGASAGFGVALGFQGENVLYGTAADVPKGPIWSVAVNDYKAPFMVGSDGVIATITSDTVERPGDTVTVEVMVDMTRTGKGIGSIQGDVRFDAESVRFLSLSTQFSGTFTPNTDSASAGVLKFGGINVSDDANTGVTEILALTFEVTGPWGSRHIVDLFVEELAATDLSDLTAKVVTNDGFILVDPGALSLAVRGESLSREQSKPYMLRAGIADLRAPLGFMGGRVWLDPTVVQVDSVTTGSFGGTLDWNGSMLADSGFVRVAVANGEPPTADSVDMAVVWITAVLQGGDSTDIAWDVEELTEAETFGDLQPFVSLVESYRAGVAAGIWGDANVDKNISALDALICLSHVVGKDIGEFDGTACDVVPDDGLTFTGKVSALDALAILSHVVGKTLPDHFRVGDNM